VDKWLVSVIQSTYADATTAVRVIWSNSMKCNQCSQCIHRKCSGVSGKLQNAAGIRGVLLGSCFEKLWP